MKADTSMRNYPEVVINCSLQTIVLRLYNIDIMEANQLREGFWNLRHSKAGGTQKFLQSGKLCGSLPNLLNQTQCPVYLDKNFGC